MIAAGSVVCRLIWAATTGTATMPSTSAQQSAYETFRITSRDVSTVPGTGPDENRPSAAASAADLAHRARGALERRALVDLVLELLVLDGLEEDGCERVVTCAGAQRTAQI